MSNQEEISGNSVVSIPDLENIQVLSNFFFWFSNSINLSTNIDQIEMPDLDDWSER